MDIFAKFRQNVILAPYTTFKIGGAADYFFEARTKEELIQAIEVAVSRNLPYFILGGGSNILVGDKGFRGVVIKNATSKISLKGIKGLVYMEAESGVNFNQFVRFTIEEGLGGLEMHLGLPGTVGGAVAMNSKWLNPPAYIRDRVHQIEVYSPDVGRRVVSSSKIQPAKEIILSAVFSLKQEDKTLLWERANQSISYRRESQPQGIFSAGCTFRNLTAAQALSTIVPNQSRSTGFLIETLGLKGKLCHQAQISPVHANFILNLGRATAQDVLTLINTIKLAAKEKYNLELEEEIVKVGEF